MDCAWKHKLGISRRFPHSQHAPLSHLPFPFPTFPYLSSYPPSRFHLLALPHSHILGRRYINHRRSSRVFQRKPDGDRDMIRCGAIGDWDGTVELDEEVGMAGVVCWETT